MAAIPPALSQARGPRDIEGALRRGGINDLTVLVDQQASRDAVIGAIEWLVQRTTRGDLVMIAIAGHGAQEPERVKGSQPDGMDTVFLLPDFATTTSGSLQRIIGDGTVQLLYPVGSDPKVLRQPDYRLPVRVRGPFGSDLVVAITSEQPMSQLEQALQPLNQRRSAVEAVKVVEKYRPPDGRFGATGIFTAP